MDPHTDIERNKTSLEVPPEDSASDYEWSLGYSILQPNPIDI